MKSRLYRHVEQLLLNNPYYRNSDKNLVWQIWFEQGMCGYDSGDYITRHNFMRAKSAGTILRTRRKVIENYKKKDLGRLVMPTKVIEKARQAKANYFKGQHVYQERI